MHRVNCFAAYLASNPAGIWDSLPLGEDRSVQDHFHTVPKFKICKARGKGKTKKGEMRENE
jgi:hypothetical protein